MVCTIHEHVAPTDESEPVLPRIRAVLVEVVAVVIHRAIVRSVQGGSLEISAKPCSRCCLLVFEVAEAGSQ
jgi:hypothetical protein